MSSFLRCTEEPPQRRLFSRFSSLFALYSLKGCTEGTPHENIYNIHKANTFPEILYFHRFESRLLSIRVKKLNPDSFLIKKVSFLISASRYFIFVENKSIIHILLISYKHKNRIKNLHQVRSSELDVHLRLPLIKDIDHVSQITLVGKTVRRLLRKFHFSLKVLDNPGIYFRSAFWFQRVSP